MNSKSQRWLVPLLIALIVLITAVLVTVLLTRKSSETSVTAGSGMPVGYAEGVTVVDDPDALKKAVDEMYAKAAQPGITLEYYNTASSTDGRDFSCHIVNAIENEYDMYIAVYADPELTDELFLSGLLRPGTGFDHITLNRALDAGTTTCFVILTQVDVVDGEQTIIGQSTITMDFKVEK